MTGNLRNILKIFLDSYAENVLVKLDISQILKTNMFFNNFPTMFQQTRDQHALSPEKSIETWKIL